MGLAVITVLAVVRLLLASAADEMDRDDPFSAVAVLMLAVALGVLGLHHARLAGGLLALLGIAQLVALAISDSRDGAGIGDLLTTAVGAVVVPILAVAALFLLAGTLEHSHQEWHQGASPAH